MTTFQLKGKTYKIVPDSDISEVPSPGCGECAGVLDNQLDLCGSHGAAGQQFNCLNGHHHYVMSHDQEPTGA